MLFDWFTVIAQVINFLILVWLLKRFLYRPILNAIDAREKRIAAEITDADTKKAQALMQRDEFQHKNAVFDMQRNARMNEAIEAANTERKQLLDAARQESYDLRAKLQASLKNEQRNLNEALSRCVSEEVFAISRKALADLAGVTLEERMTAVFLHRLRELNDSEMARLKNTFKTSSDPLLVRTAFAFPDNHNAAIETVIKEILGKDKQVQFEVAPNLVSGIEINANGQKIAWSIAEYLGSLSKRVDNQLKTHTKTGQDPDEN